jgi:Bax protein
VLPSLVRFAERLTPELFREEAGEDDEPTRQSRFEARPDREPEPAPVKSMLIEIEAPVPTRRGRARLLASGMAVAVAAVIAGGLSFVALHHPIDTPNAAGGTMPPQIASAIPPEPMVDVPAVDSLHWQTLRETFDRIGFDLDSVASGTAAVPRVLLVSLPNDLSGIADPDARKDLFLRAFLPVVLQVNEHILQDRAQLQALQTKIGSGGTLSGSEVQWLLMLSDQYGQPDSDLDELMKKVDVIPTSLALAQAIEESGWGTSRIAKGQNAMFGQFGEDPLGAWDYRAFNSLTSAVESYARNLNTHRAYREFRQARAKMHEKGSNLDAFTLASTLFRYSERGPGYVKNLRGIIRDNDLKAFDSAHLDTGAKVAVIASNDDARDVDFSRP